MIEAYFFYYSTSHCRFLHEPVLDPFGRISIAYHIMRMRYVFVITLFSTQQYNDGLRREVTVLPPGAGKLLPVFSRP